MSDPFDSREKGYEAKFKHNEELTFKIEARRNKLLGLWLAEKFGMDSSKAEIYAKEVIMADMDEPGIEDVIRKVSIDIKARGIEISENELREKIEELDIEINNSELQRIPTSNKKITTEQSKKVLKLLDLLEENEDVQQVFHNMELTEEILKTMEE